MADEKRILVVEDDLYLRELYADSLRSAGYNVETAADGEDGLKRFTEGGFDLVLMDIILPKMNGLDIVRKAKNDPLARPNKKVIFLTNLDREEHIKEALLLGDAYLIKSQVNPGSLIESVKKHLS